MGTRRRSRETALKILYSVDINPGNMDDACERILEWGRLPVDSRSFVMELVEGTLERLDMIDELIKGASLKWELGRMAAVDRNILRLAVSELTGGTGIPVRVILDEAIELAKKYGGDESGIFVNGILDRVRLDLEMDS
jgi:N utilization substance protein B